MSETKEVVKKETLSQIRKDFLSAKERFSDPGKPDGYNKSRTIRYLCGEKKYNHGDVRRVMGILHQFVRNVMNQPLTSK